MVDCFGTFPDWSPPKRGPVLVLEPKWLEPKLLRPTHTHAPDDSAPNYVEGYIVRDKMHILGHYISHDGAPMHAWLEPNLQ